jgi:hypothetical protein
MAKAGAQDKVSATPTPCTTRPANNQPYAGAAAQAAKPNADSAKPQRNTRK